MEGEKQLRSILEKNLTELSGEIWGWRKMIQRGRHSFMPSCTIGAL